MHQKHIFADRTQSFHLLRHTRIYQMNFKAYIDIPIMLNAIYKTDIP